jgi:cardiolipin synthase
MTGDNQNGERRDQVRESVRRGLRPFTVPNFITFVRLAFIPFFVIAVSQDRFELALTFFILAGVSDALDGFVARNLRMESPLGAYLDPVADKLLLTTAYIALSVPHGQNVVIPLWLTILVLFRDAYILVVALVLYLAEQRRRFPPSVWGKATTIAHTATITVVLIANITLIGDWIPRVLFLVSFALVVLSGFHYLYRTGHELDLARKEDGADREPDTD